MAALGERSRDTMSAAQSEQRRLLYLERMGIDVWVPRGDAHVQAQAAMAQEPAVEASEPPAAAPTATAPAAVAEASGLADWEELQAEVAACQRCALRAGCTQTVFGVGSRSAQLMVIGEGPGAEEDRLGEPFVGRAGALLNNMLRAIGFAREAVFIANVVKCRPPNNRDPLPEEAAACAPYLQRQIELLAPRAILALGRVAAQNLLGSTEPLGRLRGQIHRLPTGQPVVVSYHPAYLLRSPQEKAKSWQDLKRVLALLSEMR